MMNQFHRMAQMKNSEIELIEARSMHRRIRMTKPALQILMIEDNQMDVLLLKEALSRDAFNSFELTISEHLSSGLESLSKAQFDLVLLDLGLPDSQGIETFQKLHLEFPETPVVVLTGLMNEQLALEAVQSGAQDYLVKGPTSWEIASRAIRHAIERQQSQAALRETNEALQALIQASPIGIVVFDPDGYVKLWSPANEHIFGWSESETVGRILPYIPEDKQEEHMALRERVLQGEAFTGVEVRRHRKDGSPVDISISTAPLRDGQGNITGIMGLNMDITEHKQADKALQESEERFRGLYYNATIGLYRTTPDGRILMCNPAAVQLLGFESFDELTKRNLEEDGFEPNYPRQEFHERMERDGMVIGLECEWARKDGTPIFVRESATAVRDSEGKILYYDGTFEDITSRKLAEKAMRESEEKYRLLFENAPVGVFQSTPEGRYISVNPTLASIFLYDSPEEMIVQVTDIAKQIHVDPTQRELFIKLLDEEGEVREFVNQNYRKDGSVIWTMTNARAVKDQSGDILYYEGFLSDITSRVQAEEAIRLSEKKFKTLFEIAPVGISVLDRDQKIVDTNYALQMITGLKKKELLNGGYRTSTYLKPDGTLMMPDEFASTRALKEDMPIFDVETGFLTKDRGVVWTQVSAAPLNMPDASLVVITQDISERKLSEQTLRQRLAELETLYESGLSLSQLLEPKQIGQKIIDVLAEKLDWYHTTVRLYHPESDSLELLAYNLAHKTTKKEWQHAGERFRTLIARPGDGLCGWALQRGETVRCSDLPRDPHYLETVPGVRSGLYVPIKTGERTIGVISVESEKPDYFTAEDEHMAVTLAAQAAVSLENIRLFKDLQKSNDDLFLAYDETIEGWSRALDLRDRETEGHTQRVATLTEELARKMGIPDTELIHIRRGSLLHDIGKMGVPDRILLKPDKLTEEEWIIMHEHPVHAYNLLSRIEFLQPALNIPHYHHERWDGSGYPDGLLGEQIPLEARIFAIIDVFDALISDRPYRPGWPRDKAISYICEGSGSHFDPKVVEVFMRMINRQT
jgi:PAS domain S-box-containing protein/putative nucleotidyltransferase with HDIG domain